MLSSISGIIEISYNQKSGHAHLLAVLQRVAQRRASQNKKSEFYVNSAFVKPLYIFEEVQHFKQSILQVMVVFAVIVEQRDVVLAEDGIAAAGAFAHVKYKLRLGLQVAGIAFVL